MNLLLQLVLTLNLAPPAQGEDPRRFHAQLDSAVQNFSGEDREAELERLTVLLDLVERHPELAPDNHEVPESLLRAMIILAGLHLAEGDEDAAREAMERAIRTARSQDLPVKTYGRQLSQLHDDREAALAAAGEATIEVTCEVDCEVVINGRLLPGRSEELLLGDYDVWIKAGDGDWEYHEVRLATAGAVQSVAYQGPARSAVEGPAPPTPKTEPSLAHETGKKDPRYQAERTDEPGRARGARPDADSKAAFKRKLPRSAAIAGVAVGAGLVLAGGILASLDGKCEQSNELATADSSLEECGDVFESSAASWSLIGVGGGVLIAFGVHLTIDEVRLARAKGRQVMLGASFRF